MNIIFVFKTMFSIVLACAISLTTFFVVYKFGILNVCEGEDCIPFFIYLAIALLVSILPLTLFIFWLLNKTKNDLLKTIIIFLGGIFIFGLIGFLFMATMGYIR